MTQSNGPRPTNLLVQQGGSCWLFVVEALATAKEEMSGLSTKYLRIAMYAYPREESVQSAKSSSASSSARPGPRYSSTSIGSPGRNRPSTTP